MAIHAQIVGLSSIPVPGSSPVDAVSPVSVPGPVTFAAKKIGLVQGYRLAVAQRKKVIAVVRVMTVQTPNSGSSVVELNILVDQQILAPLEVHRKVFLRSVTSTAGSYGLWERCSWNRKLLRGRFVGFGSLRVFRRLRKRRACDQVSTYHRQPDYQAKQSGSRSFKLSGHEFQSLSEKAPASYLTSLPPYLCL